jgi:hypothetical protein
MVAFLVLVVLFTFAAWYGTKRAGEILGRKVNAAHHAAEYILDTAKVPPEWVKAEYQLHSPNPRWERQQKRKAIRKLRKLRSYLERTPCFTDVGSREWVLAELQFIERQWRQGELAEIMEADTLCQQEDARGTGEYILSE